MLNNQKRLPSEIYYSPKELSGLKYAKIIYIEENGQTQEICTQIKFIGDVLISLYCDCKQDFNIQYPQEVIIKFVTTDAMYYSKTILKETKKSNDIMYISVIPPQKMIRQQHRRCCRNSLERTAVLVVSDINGYSTTYIAKTVNISTCGILIKDLETMIGNEPVKVEMSKYDCYHIVLFLETDVVIKIFARYVRHEEVNGSHRYAFQFMNMKQDNIDIINKYIE